MCVSNRQFSCRIQALGNVVRRRSLTYAGSSMRNLLFTLLVLFLDSGLTTSDESRVGGPSVCVIRVSSGPFDRIERIRRK
jgi:hypothetical protein